LSYTIKLAHRMYNSDCYGIILKKNLVLIWKDNLKPTVHYPGEGRVVLVYV
jgi:hypothetical protein